MPLPPVWIRALHAKRNITMIGAQDLAADPSVLPSNEFTPTASAHPIPDTSRDGYISNLQGIEQAAPQDISLSETSFIGGNSMGFFEPSPYNHFSGGGSRQAAWNSAVNDFLPMNSNLSTDSSFPEASSSHGPALFQGPFATLPGGLQSLRPTPGDLSQQTFGIGRRCGSTSDHFTTLRVMTLVGLNAPVRARINADMQNSWVYRDFLEVVLKGQPWQSWVRPYPPGYITVTGAGYNPAGGYFIPLKLRDRETPDQVIEVYLTVLDRDSTNDRYPRNVDMVLCRDYLSKLSIPQDQNDLLTGQYQNDAASFAGAAPSLPGGNLVDFSLLGSSLPSNWMQNPDMQSINQPSSQSNVLSMQSSPGVAVSTATRSSTPYLVDDTTSSRYRQ